MRPKPPDGYWQLRSSHHLTPRWLRNRIGWGVRFYLIRRVSQEEYEKMRDDLFKDF